MIFLLKGEFILKSIKLRLMVILLLTFSVSFFSTTVFLLDQELPSERFQILGDKLYIYAVNFLETIHADFSWNNSSKSIDINIDGNSVRFFNNSMNIEINGKNIPISTPPTIINGRFFLPLIDSCKIFGLRMVTDGDNYRVFKDSSRLLTYFWIPDGLALSFDKAISFIVKKHSNGLYVLDIIGSELSGDVESYRFGKIVNFKMQNCSEDTMNDFIRLTLELEEGIKIQTEQVNNTIWLKAVEEEKYDIEKKDGNTKTIIIDPGHGGFDPGALGVTGLQEKTVTLKLSLYLKSMLEENGYKVYLTREDDSYIELQERCIFANKKGGDLFISIHMNSFDDKAVEGAEVFYYKWSDDSYRIRLGRIYGDLSDSRISELIGKKFDYVNQSVLLADEIGKSLKDNGIKVRKVIPEDYAVVAYTEMPSVLLECGYISNKSFESKMKLDHEIKKYAEIVCEGLESYLKLANGES